MLVYTMTAAVHNFVFFNPQVVCLLRGTFYTITKIQVNIIY
jgi:hypothetical protein